MSEAPAAETFCPFSIITTLDNCECRLAHVAAISHLLVNSFLTVQTLTAEQVIYTLWIYHYNAQTRRESWSLYCFISHGLVVRFFL